MKISRITVYALLSLLLLMPLISGCGSGEDDINFDFSNDFDNNNAPPPGDFLLARFDAYESLQDTILQVDELFGILANDEFRVFNTFIDYPLFTVQGGDIEGFQNGSFEYDPPIGFVGEDSFTYTLTDDLGRTSSAEVFITVRPPGFRVAQK